MRSDSPYLKIILVLCLLGILVSGWLLSIHIKFTTGQAGLTESCSILPGISGGQGCASIAVSDYSDVFGIPLAAIAMSYYFTLLILVFWAMRNFQMAFESLYVSYFLSTISIIVTVIMFVISRFVLKSFCMGCAMLWVINLAIWPCFVKHLGFNWGNALGGLLELVRAKNLQLKKERIMGSFAVGLVCLLAFSVIGLASKGLGRQESRLGDNAILTEFNAAQQVFLPQEAYGGPQSKGGGTPPVMEIVEFADFQCPACRMAAQFLKPFLLKHGDKVRVTFRNFPLDGSCNNYAPGGRHQMACALATASICAGKQDKFWPLHDLIFANQAELTPALLTELIEEAGLDKAQMEACTKDPSTKDLLQREMDWGEQIALESTPTIVINGRKMTGAKSPSELETLLDHIQENAK